MKLNESQKQAVESDAKKLLILAGAGTGKTTVMLQRIKRLVDGGVPPSNILALTFTNAAANEMSARFTKLTDKAIQPKFATFHAFCYSLLEDRKVLSAIGYKTRIPNITDEATVENIQKRLRVELNIKMSLNRLLDPPDNLSMKDKNTVEIYQKALTKAYQKQNVISFDMLIQRVSALFIKHDECITKYLNQYSYIFVDEFQDTDKLQWDFVQSFKDVALFVVGDALQAIYGFRGADSSIIKSLASDAIWDTIRLYENYRSTEDIVDFANTNSTYADDTYRVVLESTRPGLPVLCITDERENYGDPMSDRMLNQISDFCTKYEGTSAILCRTNSEVSEVTQYLYENDIEYSTSDPNKAVIDILRSVNDKAYQLNWYVSSLNQQDFRIWINSENMNMNKQLDETDEQVLWRFFDIFGERPSILSSRECISRIEDILKYEDCPFEAIRSIYDILELAPIMPDTDAQTPEEIIQYILDTVQNTLQNSLYVGTIHSSKGLEYETVAVVGVNSPTFELNSEDNKNLYYVGITRARNYLLIASGNEGRI